MKGVLLALASVLLVTLAQLTLRAAMSDFPPLTLLASHPNAVLRLAVGLGLYGLSMLFWMLALRHMPLNRLYPLLSLSYVLVWLAAILLPQFAEPFHWQSLAGVICIVAGLLCVSLPARKI